MRKGAAVPHEVLRIRAFALFWSATTACGFGASVSGVAVQVLIVQVLLATPAQIGTLSAPVRRDGRVVGGEAADPRQ